MTISVFPAILFLAVVGCLIAYPIGKKLNIQIQDELAERRKKYAALAASPINT
jgi:hypothetical protein